ncbi:hypothetical protein JCM19992_00750 [Thermostilla marina]
MSIGPINPKPYSAWPAHYPYHVGSREYSKLRDRFTSKHSYFYYCCCPCGCVGCTGGYEGNLGTEQYFIADL